MEYIHFEYIYPASSNMSKFWICYYVLIQIYVSVAMAHVFHNTTFHDIVTAFDVDTESGDIYVSLNNDLVRLTSNLRVKYEYKIFPNAKKRHCVRLLFPCSSNDKSENVTLTLFNVIKSNNNSNYIFACSASVEQCILVTMNGIAEKYIPDVNTRPQITTYFETKTPPTLVFSGTSANQTANYLLYTFSNVEIGLHHSARRHAFNLSHFDVSNVNRTFTIGEPVFSLGVKSPVMLNVIQGFEYRTCAYFLVSYSVYGALTKHSSLIRVQHDASDKHAEFVETRLQCGEHNDPLRAYIDDGADAPMFIVFRSTGSTIVCSMTMGRVEAYFNGVLEDYYKLGKGSIPWWAQMHDTRKNNHVLLVSATKLYLTAALSLDDVPDVTAIVAIEMTQSRLFYLAASDGNLFQIAESGGLSYKTDLTTNIGPVANVTGLRYYGNTMYFAVANKLYSMDIPDCGRHAEKDECMSDTSCSWCPKQAVGDQGNSTSFHCISQTATRDHKCNATSMQLVKFGSTSVVRRHMYADSIHPLWTISSGGTLVTITGEGVSDLDDARLGFAHNDITISANYGLCNIDTYRNQSALRCTTPALDRILQPLSNEPISTRMTLYSGNDFIDIFLKHGLSTLIILEDPVVFEFGKIEFINGSVPDEMMLWINGSVFQNIEEKDIRVIIWKDDHCPVTMVTDTQVVCKPTLPRRHPFLHLPRLVTVLIGETLIYYPGHVIFYDGILPETQTTTEPTESTTGMTEHTNFVNTGHFGQSISENTADAVSPTSTTVTNGSTTESGTTVIGRIHLVGVSPTSVPISDSILSSDVSTGYSDEVNYIAVSVSAAGVMVILVMVVVLIVFRKAITKKLTHRDGNPAAVPETLTLTEGRAAHNMGYNSAAVTNYSFNISPTVESASFISDDEDNETMCVQSITKRLEEARLIIRRECLRVHNVIGQGNFGSVYRGALTRGHLDMEVAVKTLHNNQPREIDIRQFLKEAYVMHTFNHDNVMALVGICLEIDEMPLVILPYMQHGDLLKYLQNGTNLPTVKHLVQFCLEIATGMEYLARTKFVHRDLAARNCMLDANLHVRIADFGLSRDVYETSYYSTCHKGTQLPVKWMAIESLSNGIYNEQTDVWSYGVTLWEVMTRGVRPYVAVDNWDVERYLRAGRRLPQPMYCPPHLYKLMRKCWSEAPDDRPTFVTIRDCVSAMLDRANQRHGDAYRQKDMDNIYVNIAMGASYNYENDE